MINTITGTVSTAGEDIYAVPGSKKIEVSLVRFTDTAADYHIYLYKFVRQTASYSLIYRMQLDAGDTLSDSSTYVLYPGESLYAISTSAFTQYTLIINQLQ